MMHGSDGDESLQLVLVEGWCIARILAAVTSVMLLSILAALLWILVGVGGQTSATSGTWVSRGPVVGAGGRWDDVAGPGGRLEQAGDAGGRVEAGVVLGAFVLLLGWTGIGAWAVLSWLVG